MGMVDSAPLYLLGCSKFSRPDYATRQDVFESCLAVRLSIRLVIPCFELKESPEDYNARHIRPHMHDPRNPTNASSIHWSLTGYILDYPASVFRIGDGTRT
jgi:hypothetical protein